MSLRRSMMPEDANLPSKPPAETSFTVKVLHPRWRGGRGQLRFDKNSDVVWRIRGRRDGIRWYGYGKYKFTETSVTITWHRTGVTERFGLHSPQLFISESSTATPVDQFVGIAISERSIIFPSRVVVPVGNGFEVSLRLHTSDLKTFRQVFSRKEYETAALPDYARSIIDLGANVGLASVFFAMRYPEAKIVAVEPEADNFRALQGNIEALGSRVRAEHAAIWHEDGSIRLQSETAEGVPLPSWGMTVSETGDRGAITPAVRVDTLMDRYGFKTVDILKVDIEGAELELFAHGADKWTSRVKLVLVETHNRFRPGSEEAVRAALAGKFRQAPSSGENLVFERID
jgi:FkbM family methyltransferase